MNDPKSVAAYEELLTLRQENAQLKAQLEAVRKEVSWRSELTLSLQAQLEDAKTQHNRNESSKEMAGSSRNAKSQTSSQRDNAVDGGLRVRLVARDSTPQSLTKESEQVKTPLAWMHELKVVDNPDTMCIKIAAIQADARQSQLKELKLYESGGTYLVKELQSDLDDARKEAAKTLVQLGKVEVQRDECLSLLRVLQPQVKMWLAGSSEYEWIGKLLDGRFGEGIYKP